MTTRRWVVPAAGAAVALAVLTTHASATSGPRSTGAPRLTVIDPRSCYFSPPPKGNSGTIPEAHVRVRGSGFIPGTKVSVGIGYLPDQVIEAADRHGSFTASVQVSALPPRPKAFPVFSEPVVAHAPHGVRVASKKVSYVLRTQTLYINQAIYSAGSYVPWNVSMILDAVGLRPGQDERVFYLTGPTQSDRLASLPAGRASAHCGAIRFTGCGRRVKTRPPAPLEN